MGIDNKNNNTNGSTSTTSIMLIDQPCSSSSLQQQQKPIRKHDTYRIISLPEPTSGHARDYLLITSNIYEIQALSAPISSSSSTSAVKTCDKQMFTETYNSYFVSSSRIAHQKELKLGTRVDPLYFVLGIFSRKMRTERGKKSHQWQPLDQVMKGIPEVIQRALLLHPANSFSAKKVTPEKDNASNCCSNSSAKKMEQFGQLKHFFQVDDTIDDDDVYYKFSTDKVKKWLLLKYGNIINMLRTQYSKSKKLKKEMEERLTASGKGNGGDGAFNVSFHLGGGETGDEKTHIVQENNANNDTNNPSMDFELSKEETKLVQVMAFQLLSEYLTDDIAIELKHELQLEDHHVTKKKKVNDESGGSISPSSSSSSAAPITPNSSILVDTDDEDLCGAGNGRSRKRHRDEETDKNNENDDEPSLQVSSSTLPSSWEGALPGENDRDQLLQYTMGHGGGKMLGMDDDYEEETQKKKKLNQAQSVGLKKLAKVNTKGMKSIASFFGGGGNKKKKQRK